MNDSGFTTSARRFRGRRRRFLLVATAALAATGIAMGLSFTADTGTTTVTVSPGSSGSLVYPISKATAGTVSALPSGPTWGTSSASPSAAALVYNTKATQQTGGPQTVGSDVVAPVWSPVSGASGSVTSGGDLFVIDGRTSSAGGANHITVNVYITNLSDLQAAYSSFAWPVDLYVADGSSPIVPASWQAVNPTTMSSLAAATPAKSTGTVTFTANQFFLTNTGGYLSYYLPTGPDLFYELAMDGGGSFYTVNQGGTLGPNFFVTAQAT